MKKEEFLLELRSRLSGLPGDAVEERVQYYGELIDHRMETGIAEEEAVAGIGSLNETVGQIMSEIPLTQLVKRRVDPRKKHSTAKIVLLILFFPIWLPLLTVFSVVFFSLYVTLWSLVIAFFFVSIGIAAGALFCIMAAVGYFIAGKPFGGLFLIGGSFILAGIAVLLFLFNAGFAKRLVKMTAKIALSIKGIFVKGADK